MIDIGHRRRGSHQPPAAASRPLSLDPVPLAKILCPLWGNSEHSPLPFPLANLLIPCPRAVNALANANGRWPLAVAGCCRQVREDRQERDIPFALSLSLTPSSGHCNSTLAATGDLICQKMVDKREHIDPRRTARFALTTMLVIAPIQFHWFRFLERKFKTSANIGRVKTGLYRVFVDQAFCAPFLTASFLFTVNLMESFSVDTALERTKRIYWEVITNNYKYWPFVQTVNLTLVPLHLRVVFLQFFAIFWNIYISHKANN